MFDLCVFCFRQLRTFILKTSRCLAAMMHNMFDLTINLEQFSYGRNSRTESHYLFPTRKAMSMCSKETVFAMFSFLPWITDLVTTSSRRIAKPDVACRGPSNFIHQKLRMLLYPDGLIIDGKLRRSIFHLCTSRVLRWMDCILGIEFLDIAYCTTNRSLQGCDCAVLELYRMFFERLLHGREEHV